jgi:hypothetical protein
MPGPYWCDVTDLDRCEHGRHCIDECVGCPGGQSTGNLLLQPGQLIGHNMYGYKIVVPTNPIDRGDARKWTVAPPPKKNTLEHSPAEQS